MSFVYFIHDKKTRRVKIGFSVDPALRLAVLQTGSSSHLRLLGYSSGSRKTEALIHDLLRDFREDGEWFQYNYPVKDFIALALNSGLGQAVAKYEKVRIQQDQRDSARPPPPKLAPETKRPFRAACECSLCNPRMRTVETLTAVLMEDGVPYERALEAAMAGYERLRGVAPSNLRYGVPVRLDFNAAS